MLRLNNKDFTVMELERLISLMNVVLGERQVRGDKKDVVYNEIQELIKGTTITNPEEGLLPIPIQWNFKFQLLMVPTTVEMTKAVKYAMRSTEVNMNIEKRFNAICREEINWFINGVDIFSMPGNDSTIEDKHD